MALHVGGIQFIEGLAAFYGCGACGAAVADPTLHEQWHRGNDADVVVAAVRRAAPSPLGEEAPPLPAEPVTIAPAAKAAAQKVGR